MVFTTLISDWADALYDESVSDGIARDSRKQQQ